MVSTDPLPTINYKYVNEANNFRLSATDEMMVTIDIRDMKWLSSYARFSTNITDPLVLIGEKEGVINVNFS